MGAEPGAAASARPSRFHWRSAFRPPPPPVVRLAHRTVEALRLLSWQRWAERWEGHLLWQRGICAARSGLSVGRPHRVRGDGRAGRAGRAARRDGVGGGDSSLFLMFLSGVAASSAMILPGVSGGYLLLILGQCRRFYSLE